MPILGLFEKYYKINYNIAFMVRFPTAEHRGGSIAKPELKVGFDTKEQQRFEAVLSDLLPYLQRGKVALAGGAALRHHLTIRDIPHPNPQFKDLDLLIEDPGVILGRISDRDSGFLISHFHPRKNPNILASFFIKMIHVATKTNVDFFSYAPFSPDYFAEVSFQGQIIQIPSPESLLTIALLDTLKALEAFKKAPCKRLTTIDLLSGVVDWRVAQQVWQGQGLDRTSLSDSISMIETVYLMHPEQFVGKVFGKKPIANCTDCVQTPEFPIASSELVRSILGIGSSAPPH